jgi:hypothetical protein
MALNFYCKKVMKITLKHDRDIYLSFQKNSRVPQSTRDLLSCRRQKHKKGKDDKWKGKREGSKAY